MKTAILFFRLTVLAPALALAACQQQEPSSTFPRDRSQDEAVVEGGTAGADAPKAAMATAPEPALAEAEPEAPIETLEAAATSEPEPVHLNLSIPKDILDETTDTGFPSTQRAALPDLFAKKGKSGTQVSSKLHFEQGEQASMDTISGAEITVKVPLD